MDDRGKIILSFRASRTVPNAPQRELCRHGRRNGAFMVDNKFYTIDFHCHVYPEKIAEKAALATADFYSEGALGKGTFADLISTSERSGTDFFVIQSVATTPHQVHSINRFISELASSAPDRALGFGAMHPESEDIDGDFDELLSLGLKGVKIHPDIQKFALDDPRCFRIYARCQDAGLPILIHTGDRRYDYSNPNRLMPILRKFPTLRVVGAHLGGWSIFDEASRALCDFENLYVDCSSALQYLTPELAVEIFNRYGIEKVMYGTDYPMWSPEQEIERFMGLPLSDSERRLILSENAKRLLGESVSASSD